MRTLLLALALFSSPIGAQVIRRAHPSDASTLGGYRPGLSVERARAVRGAHWGECGYRSDVPCLSRDTTIGGVAMHFLAAPDSSGHVQSVILTPVAELDTEAQCRVAQSALERVVRPLGAADDHGKFGEPRWHTSDGLTVWFTAACSEHGGFVFVTLAPKGRPSL